MDVMKKGKPSGGGPPPAGGPGMMSPSPMPGPMPGMGVDPMQAMMGAMGPFGLSAGNAQGLPVGGSMPPTMPPGLNSPLLEALLGGGSMAPPSPEMEPDLLQLLQLLMLTQGGQPPSGVDMMPDTTGQVMGY